MQSSWTEYPILPRSGNPDIAAAGGPRGAPAEENQRPPSTVSFASPIEWVVNIDAVSIGDVLGPAAGDEDNLTLAEIDA